MNPELNELYQEIILDHNRRPRNFRPMEHPTHSADGHNPLCGDEITVFLHVDNDRVTDVSFQGEGCAISRASASLMTLKLKGLTVDEARKRFDEVVGVLAGGNDAPGFPDHLGDLVALEGVRQFPARIKCATLSWHAFKAAVEGEKIVSTEEPEPFAKPDS